MVENSLEQDVVRSGFGDPVRHYHIQLSQKKFACLSRIPGQPWTAEIYTFTGHVGYSFPCGESIPKISRKFGDLGRALSWIRCPKDVADLILRKEKIRSFLE